MSWGELKRTLGNYSGLQEQLGMASIASHEMSHMVRCAGP